MKHLITIAWEWGSRCFGEGHMMNVPVRALRAAEEVIELAQAVGVPETKMALLVKTVYARPGGMAYQEVGGSMVTLMILCRALGIDPEEAFVLELRRCLSKSPESFERRNQEKSDLGLD